MDRDGLTPLHMATEINHTAMAELLLARGANVNAKDKGGVTPINAATGEDRRENIVELLRRHGAQD